MKITRDQTKVLATAIGLEIPEADLDNITIRVSELLESMARIELELGDEMDKVEPIPPVFPREDF
jgi:hypothetical protein